VLLDELTPFRRRALRAAPLQAIAAVLDDAAIKWVAAVSSTSDDAVMGWRGRVDSDEDLEARE
jgi:hypothetical protein